MALTLFIIGLGLLAGCALNLMRAWLDRPGVIKGVDGRWRAARSNWRRR
jgi:hypothetical protein